jgi:hypothetical protein
MSIGAAPPFEAVLFGAADGALGSLGDGAFGGVQHAQTQHKSAARAHLGARIFRMQRF